MMPRWLIDSAGRTLGIVNRFGEIYALEPSGPPSFARQQRAPAAQNAVPIITRNIPRPPTPQKPTSIEVEKPATPTPAPAQGSLF